MQSKINALYETLKTNMTIGSKLGRSLRVAPKEFIWLGILSQLGEVYDNTIHSCDYYRGECGYLIVNFEDISIGFSEWVDFEHLGEGAGHNISCSISGNKADSAEYFKNFMHIKHPTPNFSLMNHLDDLKKWYDVEYDKKILPYIQMSPATSKWLEHENKYKTEIDNIEKKVKDEVCNG